jgi:hypothetical protein
MLKLNELEGMFDSLDKAGSRQKEIFDLMIAEKRYIKPKKYRDHENMIAWAMDYFMSQEFETLPVDIQELCEMHIEERAQIAATEKPSGAPAPAPGPDASAPAPLPPPSGPAPITPGGI